MCKSNFSAVLKVTRLIIFVVGLMGTATVPVLAVSGGRVHGRYMMGISGSGVGTGSVSCSGGTDCNENASGSFRGSGVGNGTFSVVLRYSIASPIGNGSGGSCYGASGTITLAKANGAAVTLGEVGLLCEVASGGSDTAPNTFNGSYIIQSGSGSYSNSAGAGSSVLAIDASGNAYLNLNGAMGTGMGGGMGGM